MASPNPLANHSTIPARNDAAWAIDHSMNKDASNGEIHPLSYPPVKLQSIPTIIAAIRIGTIVILKLKNKRTNHRDSPFCSGNLVKFCTIFELESIATNTYDTANEMKDIATSTSCDSTKNRRIVEINAIIIM